MKPLDVLLREIETPEDLSTWMKISIRYGYMDKHGKIIEGIPDNQAYSNNYRLQTPDQLIMNKYGVCWDQAELQRVVLTALGIENEVIFMISDIPPNYPTHTFSIFKREDRYFWFENSWESHVGIHGPFKTKQELINMVHYFSEKEDKQKSAWRAGSLPQPKYGISCGEFMKFATKAIGHTTLFKEDATLSENIVSNLRSQVNLELQKYIEYHILPRYDKFDGGHKEEHVNHVIDFSLFLGEKYKLNPNILYAAAAFHDVALEHGRDNHHTDSAKTVLKDTHLKKWFTPEEIKLIVEMCEDHRASSKNPPRTIYGKIISDADRTDSLTIERMFIRSSKFNLTQNPDLSDDELFETMYSHLTEKYGDGGYAKLILPETIAYVNQESKETKRILASKSESRKAFDKLVKEGYIRRNFSESVNTMQSKKAIIADYDFDGETLVCLDEASFRLKKGKYTWSPENVKVVNETGKYIGYSDNPNCVVIPVRNEAYICAVKPFKQGDQLTIHTKTFSRDLSENLVQERAIQVYDPESKLLFESMIYQSKPYNLKSGVPDEYEFSRCCDQWNNMLLDANTKEKAIELFQVFKHNRDRLDKKDSRTGRFINEIKNREALLHRKYNKLTEDTNLVSEDQEELLSEELSPNKRKQIETTILKTFSLFDKTGKNTEKWKAKFKTMSNNDFDNWMKKLATNDKEGIPIEILPMVNESKLSDIKDAADYLGVELEQYIYYPHEDKENPVRSAYKVPILALPLKRLQQVISKKNSMTTDITQRNAMTGQLTSDSRISRISDSETYAMTVIGADNSLKELMSARSDNMESKMLMYNQIATQGYVNLEDIQSQDIEASQTVNTVDVFFLGACVKTDLITPTLELPRTLKNKNKKVLTRTKYEQN